MFIEKVMTINFDYQLMVYVVFLTNMGSYGISEVHEGNQTVQVKLWKEFYYCSNLTLSTFFLCHSSKEEQGTPENMGMKIQFTECKSE